MNNAATIQDLENKIAELNAKVDSDIQCLRVDLQSAWDCRNDVWTMDGVSQETCIVKRNANDNDFTCSIDPESMVTLKFLFRSVKANHSMNSLAHAIMKGKITSDNLSVNQ